MGAQFYPNCLQIKVQNGGSVALPEGIPLPGSYDPYDPGILVQLWQITLQNPNYTAPGTSYFRECRHAYYTHVYDR